MMNESILHDVTEVKSLTNPDEVNEYLALGWILLDASAEHGFILGWNKAERVVPAYPDSKKEKRAEPFRFSLANIPVGAKIEFWNENSQYSGTSCTVIDDKHVEYQGQTYTLTSLACFIMKTERFSNAPKYFKYNGEWLNDLRKKYSGE